MDENDTLVELFTLLQDVYNPLLSGQFDAKIADSLKQEFASRT